MNQETVSATASTQRRTTRFVSDEERLASFGRAIEDLQRRVHAQVGAEDLLYIRRVHRFARAMEVVGRSLVHFSLEPVSFSTGVFALFVSKQIDATEIGHTVLHGAFDKLDSTQRFNSRTYRWPIPIDEESWRAGHNVRHHQSTNVAGKDPDMDFGPVRLTSRTPHRWEHWFQVPFSLFVMIPNFTFMMNAHFTGFEDFYRAYRGDGRMLALRDLSASSIGGALRRTVRKYARYYAKEYVVFPVLAGPFFWKVLLGNWLSEVMRDTYSAATIYCGHVGGAKSYPEGTKARSRAEWYAMQVESSNDFEVSWPVSVLCGALDRQIEHHLFPGLPTQRIRAVAPEVRRICEEHGIEYRTDSWPRTLRKMFREVVELSKPDGTGLLGGVRRAAAAMA